jgi:hypothetical protein
VAVLFAVVAIAIYLTTSVVAWRSPEATQPMAWAYIADAVLWVPWSAIGALIAIRGVRTQGSTMLALAVAIGGFMGALPHLQLLGVTRSWYGPLGLASAFLAMGAYLRASQLFPRPLTRSNVLSSNASWRGVPWLPPLLAGLLRPWACWALVGAWLLPGRLSLKWMTNAGLVIMVLLGAAYWRIHLRVGSAPVRNRVTWLLQTAIVFAMLHAVLISLMALLRGAGASQDEQAYVLVGYRILQAIGVCGSLGMAVFGAGAFNPSLVLRSTVVYGAAISLLLFVLNVISSVVVDIAVGALGLNDRLIAATLGAIAGLLLEPLARYFRRTLERATAGPTPDARA